MADREQARETVNAADLRPVLETLRSMCDGDFSARVQDRSDGIAGELAGVVNRVAARNEHFSAELARVRREVAGNGRLDERISDSPGTGQWSGTVRDANQLMNALATPMLSAIRVLDAVADGDLGHHVELGDGERQRGDLRLLAHGLNRVVDRLSLFTGEITRLAQEVGTEGRLGGRASVRGLPGTWRQVTESVNTMASRLTKQVRDIALVTTAVARGDLTRKVTVEATGELLELKLTVNTMVDQLSAFADEVTRVAREVGTDGNLGGQAHVKDVSGVWKDLTNNVNFMASNLTSQVRNIAQVTTAVARGDLSQKITVDANGEILQLKLTINTMVDQLSAFADEVTRVAREVGTDGNLGGQAHVKDVSGVWKDLTENVNFMALNLTSQVRNIAQVATAVANGDLSKKIDVDARGEILELKTTLNTMVDQLSAFADEVTRVAREVGTDGNLGGQALVRDVSGVWKDLTENVNFMALNLTSQVRNIAQVTTAVANGDLSKKIDVDARGEILELKTTVNTMVDQLRGFADEVTRVAREVGSEGQLGGRAQVEGVHGTWKRLTTGVNELASNLTTQVRAIAEVASAVAQGDLTPSISVEARGEVAELKNNVNRMVSNLRETTRTKDWLESNLTRIAGLMQGHRDLVEVADLILRELAPLVNAHSEAFFLVDPNDRDGNLEFIAGYGIEGPAHERLESTSPLRGLVAQAVKQRERILIENAPADYVTIESGIGEAPATSILILPIVFEDRLLGVIEVASLGTFNEVQLTFIDQFAQTIGVSINTILANARTESLLSESQRLTSELRQRSDELQRSNAELEEKAALLATSSQYKSEFLANMSHELRTPLNSLLLLARLLADNPDGRLTEREVEFAATIHRSGSDLLQLINDILDLSKVEAGRMDLRPKRLPLTKLLDYVRATFRPLALDRGLDFEVTVGDDVPAELYSDEQRLQQVLRNLLSNAVKFTSSGGVYLRVEKVPAERFEKETLRTAGTVLAFAVEDTGIGIPPEKLSVIFEAFKQSDGTTNRKYGGTGLGLSISREIAGLLGGHIDVESTPGEGSRFTLYAPAELPRAALMGETAVSLTPVETAGDVAPLPPGASRPTEEPAEEPAVRPEPEPAAPPPPEQPAPAAGAGDGQPWREERQTGTWPETTQLKKWLSGRPGQVLTGRQILIVDDDIRNVFALTHMLGRVGISVRYAENGRECFEVLERSPEVSLVLMDIMMPEIDGYEAIRTIRDTPRLAGLPIVALTAKAMSGDRDKALRAGADAYISKPVDVDLLLTAIYEQIDAREGEGATSHRAAGASEMPPAPDRPPDDPASPTEPPP
jgi:signal transduction histidine kinase/HAMP domain-containing protein/CheY-like chemotaxis protein